MRRLHRALFAFACAFFAVAALALAAPTVWAQAWPSHAVRLLVPLGASSGVDIGARLFADKLQARWGQPAVVENRPGGDGLVAIGAFVAAHDDHVLLVTPTSSFTAHPYLHDTLPYKASDLVPIARVSVTVIIVAVPTALDVHSMAELVAYARKNPGKLNWAGVTGALDLSFEAFVKKEGLSMSKVPYRNPVDAARDLAENRVQVYESALAIVQPQLQAGKIRLLAVTNTVRAHVMPDLPTVAEAGYPILSLDGLVGYFGPTNMTTAVRDRIAADVLEVGKDPTIASRLETTGQIVSLGGPADFAASIAAQRAKVDEIGKVLGIKPAQ